MAGRLARIAGHSAAILLHPLQPPLIKKNQNSYMVLFLKFIASVVPTIQYDYTRAVGEQ